MTVDPAIIANTALALMEHRLEHPTSLWAKACETYREGYGSYELRDRVWEAACVMEAGRVEADELVDAQGKHLGDELMVHVGCWDFDVLPALADMFADRWLTCEDDVVTDTEVRNALMTMAELNTV